MIFHKSDGSIVSVIGMTDMNCPTCEGATENEVKMGIFQKRPDSTTLVCLRCAHSMTVANTEYREVKNDEGGGSQ